MGLKKSTKIIFLDIDGVLNTTESLLDDRLALDLEKIRRLAQVLRSTLAQIVLSSTWRLFPETIEHLLTVFEQCDIDRSLVIGSTRHLDFAKRTDEILEWMNRNGPFAQWVAVDDMNLEGMCPSRFCSHFVQTKSEEGLTEEKAQQMEEILGCSVFSQKDFLAATVEAISKFSPKVNSLKRKSIFIGAVNPCQKRVSPSDIFRQID